MNIKKWFYERGFQVTVKKGIRHNATMYYIKHVRTGEEIISNKLEYLQNYLIQDRGHNDGI